MLFWLILATVCSVMGGFIGMDLYTKWRDASR